jgi:glycosyltransferase involved in cell wall biosynthesis
MREFCAQVEVLPRPVYHPGALKATLGYLSQWPRSLVDVYSLAMAERVQHAVAAGWADVLIASQLQTMRYLELAPQVPSIFEEAEVTIFNNRIEEAQGVASRFRAQLSLSKLEHAVRAMMERGVCLTVVSQAEADYISRFAPLGARVAVIPNGVDTGANAHDPTVTPELHSLIYTGAVTYDANLDAVTYFIDEVLPLVHVRVPDVRFTVTGGMGQVDVSRLAAQPGVQFTGYLPAVAPAVQSGWAMVVPLREGGGTRLKILESMALGTPVISTRKGVEGLNARPDEDILIADDPQAMTEAICRLFDDPAGRARLAANARALVEREYDWTKIASRLMDEIEAVAARRQKIM